MLPLPMQLLMYRPLLPNSRCNAEGGSMETHLRLCMLSPTLHDYLEQLTVYREKLHLLLSSPIKLSVCVCLGSRWYVYNYNMRSSPY